MLTSNNQIPHVTADPTERETDMTNLYDPTLILAADVLDDLERVRIANENRLRQLTRPVDQLDEDGESRGFGLTDAEPAVARLRAIVDTLVVVEKDAIRNLEKSLAAHPLGPWVKGQVGIGMKQGARLIATLGNPAWNDLHDRPRRIQELWSYAGYGVVDGHAPRRERGLKMNWNPDARMRVRLVSESCIKQSHSPYRATYDAARVQYADATHAAPCARCGPAGKPALVGSALSLNHQHARALRLVSKQILLDLWLEARRLSTPEAEAC